MIHFLCPNCEGKLKAPERASGSQTKCPACGLSIEVPAPDSLIRNQRTDFLHPPAPIREDLDFKVGRSKTYASKKTIFALLGATSLVAVVVGLVVYERNRPLRTFGADWEKALDTPLAEIQEKQNSVARTFEEAWEKSKLEKSSGPSTLAELIRFFREHGMPPSRTGFINHTVDGDMWFEFADPKLIEEQKALETRKQEVCNALEANQRERARKASIVYKEYVAAKNALINGGQAVNNLKNHQRVQDERAQKEKQIDEEFVRANQPLLEKEHKIQQELTALEKRIASQEVVVTCCLNDGVAEANLRGRKEKLELANDARRMDDHFLRWRNFVFEGEPKILDKVKRFLRSQG